MGIVHLYRHIERHTVPEPARRHPVIDGEHSSDVQVVDRTQPVLVRKRPDRPAVLFGCQRYVSHVVLQYRGPQILS